MQQAIKIIDDFKAHKWNAPHLIERVCKLQEDARETLLFCELYLREFDESSTIFQDCISYVSEDGLAHLVKIAVDMLTLNGRNSVTDALIKHVSLQAGYLLHPHLELIFKHEVNIGSYFEFYPWRDIDAKTAAKFEAMLASSGDLGERRRLVRALIESRNLQAVKFAYDFALGHEIYDAQRLDRLLEDACMTREGDEIHGYCQSKAYHINFPSGYFAPPEQPFLSRAKHPTWISAASLHQGVQDKSPNLSYKFGGLIADDKNNPFMHIITLEPLPAGFGVSGLNRLVLGAHVREINEWGMVFYVHNESGEPVKIGQNREITDYQDEPITPCEVTLTPTPARWIRQSWGSSNGRQNLFRLGGEPTWIQGAQVPLCPKCGCKMQFLIQLDTGLPCIDGGEMYFGSGGICYGFWCDECKTSGYFRQCT